MFFYVKSLNELEPFIQLGAAFVDLTMKDKLLIRLSLPLEYHKTSPHLPGNVRSIGPFTSARGMHLYITIIRDKTSSMTITRTRIAKYKEPVSKTWTALIAPKHRRIRKWKLQMLNIKISMTLLNMLFFSVCLLEREKVHEKVFCLSSGTPTEFLLNVGREKPKQGSDKNS